MSERAKMPEDGGPWFGPDPSKHLCEKCRVRQATMVWGDEMAVTHGRREWRCEVCVLTEQLAFARERAAAIPDLERRLVVASKGSCGLPSSPDGVS